MKSGMAFDEKLLYSWRCNLFAQNNWAYQSRINHMGMCFLDEDTDINEYRSSLTDSNDVKILEQFLDSHWIDINPSTIGLEIPPEGDNIATVFTSRAMMTEQLKLFTIVF